MSRPRTINGEPVIYESPPLRLIAPEYGDYMTLFVRAGAGDTGPLLRVDLPTVMTETLRAEDRLRFYVTRTDDS